jgi:Sulfotransferase family
MTGAKGRDPELSEFGDVPNRPVMIGGCPRSGTTLLRTMLHAHPELAIPRETRFVLESWARRRRFGDLREQQNRRRLARWIFMRKKTDADRLGLDPGVAVERLLAAPPTLGSLLAECFVMFAEKHGKPRWGDKRPMYASRVAAVFDLFPSAHFINVVRDPRACIASLRKLNWYDGSIVPSVELWERSVLAMDALRPKLAADQLLDIQYEELVLDPEATLTKVVAFIAAAGDEQALAQMMRYYEVKETRSQRYHSNLERPLDASRVSGWSESLSREEVAFIEEETAPLMERWGYERTAAEVRGPAPLREELATKRKRQGAARRRLKWRDRLQKHVTHRHPLAARLDGVPDAAAEPVHR